MCALAFIMTWMIYDDAMMAFLSGGGHHACAWKTNKIRSIPLECIHQLTGSAVDGWLITPLMETIGNGIPIALVTCVVPFARHAADDVSELESPLFSRPLCILAAIIAACNIALLLWFDRLMTSRFALRLSRGQQSCSPRTSRPATGEAGTAQDSTLLMNRVLLASSLLFVAHTAATATFDQRRLVGAALFMAAGLYFVRHSKWLLDQE